MRRTRSHSVPLVSSPMRHISKRPADRWLTVLQPMIDASPAAVRMVRYSSSITSAVVRTGPSANVHTPRVNALPIWNPHRPNRS